MSQPRTADGTLQPLAPLVARTLYRAGLGRVVLLSRLTRHWEEIVGSQLAAVAQPENVRSHVLFVTVTHPIWQQELLFYQSKLLRNIHNVLGEVPITRLHVSLASSAPPAPARELPPVARPLPLTAAEEQQVHAGTDGIADPDLRELVRRVWRKGWQAGRPKA